MVTHRNSGSIVDDGFGRIDDHLEPGDVIVVNTSATVPASVVARTAGGDELRVHIASPAPGGLWSVELRSPFEGGGTVPGPVLEPQTLRLPGGVALHLLARSPRAPRLWIADVEGTPDMDAYLELQGGPIRYTSGRRWPMADYQTIFATEPGSAEMPSAARPFTHQLMTRLVARGVVAVPIVLHAGVSSYEEGEAPGEERYRVPATTATIVNALRSAGGRVVAVGTTVVRALESVVDDNGVVHPGRGLTDLVVTPDRGVRAVDGLLTGWHEPRSSHLTLLEAFLPHAHLQVVYDKALTGGYLWHEFGDELLILP
jgi:S-adenosylmethionine:tRNA ribosyltransferase-isomerase